MPTAPPPRSTCFVLLCLLLCSCSNNLAPTYTGPLRTFESSFEKESDFAGFFIESADPRIWDSSHELSRELVHDGSFAHKAWITAARANDNDGLEYRPHRAYPTVQFQKTSQGVFRSPCLVSIWVYLDMPLKQRPKGHINDWMSFITLTPDASDNWNRTVLVNVGPDGYARLMHVPKQGQQEYIYQADAKNDPEGALRFPMRSWVRFDLYIDFSAEKGYAKCWQNGLLISSAKVQGGAGALAQAHFGLYASAAIATGTVYNDKLRIKEVADEAQAMMLVKAAW